MVGVGVLWFLIYEEFLLLEDPSGHLLLVVALEVLWEHYLLVSTLEDYQLVVAEDLSGYLLLLVVSEVHIESLYL